MSHCFSDNILTTSFTPRDYQVELLASALEKNVMICLGHNSSKEFIVLKLLQELSPQLRSKTNRKIAIYLTYESTGESIYNLIYHLTDLKVFNSFERMATNDDVDEGPISVDDEILIDTFEKLEYHVYILTCHDFTTFLCKSKCDNLILIIEDCHELQQQQDLENFIWTLTNKNKCAKILGLSGPLHNAECRTEELKATLEIFEKNILCKTETASDIVTVLRYCTRPTEYILQCAPPTYDEFVMYLEETIVSKLAFLEDHRYDPSEIYSDEFLDELKAIPDPKIEPRNFLNNYLEVLYEMGPWCADRAALMLLLQIEKQKVKTPYERHFLLLCMVATTFIEIRALCDYIFQQTPNEKERVEKYSTPKIHSLLKILRHFKPEENKNENFLLSKISNDVHSLDFQKLSINLENTCQSIENTDKTNEIKQIVQNLGCIIDNSQDKVINHNNKTEITLKANINLKTNNNNNHSNGKTLKMIKTEEQLPINYKNRPLQRPKRKHLPQSNRKHHYHNFNQSDIDALCGIIFCNNKNTAKILFDLLCEMSRHDADLKFLSVQFTIDRIADPVTEPKEAELEHRRQEDVLKRFRMHECNILIGTSVLEEGIDLPKCNLVVRWDPPTSYRSYVQCKGRARASQAFHIILVAPKLHIRSEILKKTQISDKSHHFVCSLKSSKKQIVSKTSSIEWTEEENCNGNNVIDLNKNEKLSNTENTNDSQSNDSSLSNDLESNNDCLPIENGINDEISQKSNENGIETINKGPKNGITKQIIENFDENKIQLFEIENNTENILIPNGIKKDLVNQDSEMNVQKMGCIVEIIEDNNNLTENSYKKGLIDMEKETNLMIEQIAQYREIEKLLLEKCANSEPTEIENLEADKYTHCIEPYKPMQDILTAASVDLGGAISLINKYCAKLPSDTFTKLTPLWRCAKTFRNNTELYQYTLRLPINSPLKHDILGLPMPSRVLARRMAALIACRELHKYGELDNNLQPIGKEGFKASEPDWEDFDLELHDEKIVNENSEPRPGTTKRRQYYYKKIASEFSNCRPIAGVESYLYLINMTLQCPIPEEQNTRGRKIYAPEDSLQGFGILTLKKIPKVSAFPIFTRSGEVKVAIDLSKDSYVLTERQIELINVFVNYTFTNVLRLQKFLMLFDPKATENCVYIVPTIKKTMKNNEITIDWDFLELIYKNADKMPKSISDEIRKNLQFDADKFKDAVVMPWYRNQDQPQYFYVAEICTHLSPESCFPGENYSTFKEYYFLKYGITIQNTKQPLLDVDHTSARLNFLTPRYVNRKGVALPTSSEETKRAKRENLEQKQILVPELCTIHPFPASLWRAAVCLPCILYRINGLLIADEIRKKVSYDIGLGQMKIIDEKFEWPMLDFGWNLSEVLKKSREAKQQQDNEKKKQENNTNEERKIDDNNLIGKSIDNEKMDDKEKNCTIKENNLKDEGEKTANDLLEEADEKLKNDFFAEIGTWSNEMAENFNKNESDEEDEWGILPPEVDLISSNKINIRYGSPTSWDVGGTTSLNNHNKQNYFHNSIDPYYTDSDASFQSDDDYDLILMANNFEDEKTGPFNIEFKSNNVAEAIETEEEQLKRQKQLAILNDTNVNEIIYQNTKNLKSGFKFTAYNKQLSKQMEPFINEFRNSIETIKNDIQNSGMLILYNQNIELKKRKLQLPDLLFGDLESLLKLIPYLERNMIIEYYKNKKQIDITSVNVKLTIDDFYEFNQIYLKQSNIQIELYSVLGSGDIFDNFIDSNNLEIHNDNEKILHIDYTKKITFKNNDENNINNNYDGDDTLSTLIETKIENLNDIENSFSFDYQPNLIGHPGPSPSIILQALTMSNANDGINLERLETIGDSFLKYAITTYLYCKYEDVHEGKLSHLRSKQVSNLNLYRLGRKKVFGECMIATKFEPHDNWLPPCYYVPKELEKALIEARIPPSHWNLADLPNIKELSAEEICELVKKKAETLKLFDDDDIDDIINEPPQIEISDNFPCFIPYNLVTQHSIPDKSVADCVEALIGAYLIECGPRGALLFMAWLGIRVLPIIKQQFDSNKSRIPGSTQPNIETNEIIIYGEWKPPKSPLLKFAPNPYEQLEYLLNGFDEFENKLNYHFKDRSYLLQAMTHASYSPNRLTDCYQRLEFLGDAVLDYLITRHLYEDPRQHSPGALTDLRSALVNNTIFASLAVRHGFHKYFKHLSPGLNEVIDRFVRIQHENGHDISEEYYLLSEEECDDAEDVEVPKALGDVFESVAGAIFLDSNMSLDAVWKVYYNMMKPEIEQFSNSVPKSPIRELLELEPETAKFGKPEKLADGRRVRVSVEVFGKGVFRGIGRNYRIAKCTAAKCALRQLKKQGLISKKH